jgi:hypothetical protein
VLNGVMVEEGGAALLVFPVANVDMVWRRRHDVRRRLIAHRDIDNVTL